MKKIYLLSSFLLLFSHAILANPNESEAVWEVIPVDSELVITDDNGDSKTINPACAFETITNPLDGSQIDNSFHFYFKQGRSDKLVVYFNGGGACWDDATCVSSLALAGVEGERPTYNPTVHQANSPVGAGGIFDDENIKNPFKDWSKVFIPYCTGDIHVGSSETTYVDIGGLVTGIADYEFEVKHHGFDNFMAVRDWIKTEYNGDNGALNDLLVTGSSAGGYGATFNFSYLQTAFPETKAVLFADASEAVVTQGFLDNVFSVGGNWNVENTLPAILADELGSFTKEAFNAEIFTILTTEYPENRFAQYTTAFDAVQVQFLKIMDQLDDSNTNPFSWGLTADDATYFGEWNFRMESSLDYIAGTTSNYQYYIGEGTIHTILTDAFGTTDVPHPFYDEKSAEKMGFTNWIDSLVNSQVFNAENLKYSN